MSYERARHDMVQNQLRMRGIHDDRVLRAMSEIPRERFLPPEQRPYAYDDRAVPAAFGQTMSQPYVVARMTEVMDLHPFMKVLEIGTGTGYQAAVILALGAELWTIERIPELSLTASRCLADLGFTRLHAIIGDGSKGYGPEAPYDRIVVTAAAPQMPRTLLAQLRLKGLMVLPVGGVDEQTVVVVEKLPDRIIERPVFPCRFVKLLGDEGWPETSQN